MIGSAAEYTYADGEIVRAEPILGHLDLGPGKPEHIFARTGRLPVFAGGNADVDIEMLASAQFALLINHDDADREFASTTSAEASLTKAREPPTWTGRTRRSPPRSPTPIPPRWAITSRASHTPNTGGRPGKPPPYSASNPTNRCWTCGPHC